MKYFIIAAVFVMGISEAACIDKQTASGLKADATKTFRTSWAETKGIYSLQDVGREFVETIDWIDSVTCTEDVVPSSLPKVFLDEVLTGDTVGRMG